MRRTIQIWPIYVLFILANVIFLFAIGNHAPLADLLTFTHNFRMMPVDYDATGGGWPAFAHLWTISVEEQFYLVFPFLFPFLVRSRLQLAPWAFVAAGPLIRFWFSGVAEGMGRGDEHAAFAVYVFSPGHFDAFAMGALLALNRDRITASPALAWRLFGIALAAGAVYVGY
jgi:peptidoglycan/LPS O-acetylase OafA/YrhL